MEVRGDGASKVLLLSDNPGEERHYLLQRLIRRAGFQPTHFYYADLTNFTGELPHDVRVVVPMGERALQFTTMEPGIGRWRGRVIVNNDGRFTLPTFKPSKLLHRKRGKFDAPDPEQLRNPPRLQKLFIRDLHYAVHIAHNGFTRHEVDYLLDPTPEAFQRWVDAYMGQLAGDPDTLLSWDIETPYKAKIVEEEELEESEAATQVNTDVLRHSFSYKMHTAVTVPHDPRYYPALKQLLAAKGAKVGWNFLYFDVPVMEGHGWEVNGILYDGMDAWHWLYPQLDKGLEAVSADATDLLPWKHLSDAEPEWYSAVDADAALRNVMWIHNRIRKAGPKVWQHYQELAVEVMDYMRAAGKRGTPLDLEKQRELAPLMDAEIARLDAEIQRIVPESLKPRKRYKRTPEVFAEHAELLEMPRVIVKDGESYAGARTFLRVEEPGDVKQCSHCGTPVGNWAEHMKGRSKGTKKEPDVFNRCKAAGATAVKVPGVLTEWDEVLPFNGNSSTQLIAYMKAHKHPVGKNKKDPGVDSADAAHLRELAGMFDRGTDRLPEESDFPLYPLALAYHDVSKAKTTYMPKPDAEGLIHSTYTNTPWTWRYGSRALNMTTWGKREEKVWARKARLQIISRDGWKFVQADSSSAEAVIQGWFMADTNYMDLATQSIHTWLSCKYLGWDFNPDTAKRVKNEHKPIYDGMKVANFTINFGGSAYGMHMSNKKLFPKKADADRMVDAVYQLLPTLEDYHWNLRGLAQKQGYIVSPWGIRFDFFDVYTYDRDPRTGDIRYNGRGRPMLKLGKDGKAVVAALPQHSNGMFSRENTIAIGRSEWGQYMPASFSVHDSYKLRVPDHLVDGAVEMLQTTLSRPIEALGGLKLGCEVEVGSNWGDYHVHGPDCQRDGRVCEQFENPGGMKGVAKVVAREQNLSWMPNFKADFAAAAEKAA